MLTVPEARERLQSAGHWREGLVLDPFDWLVDQAPAGALDGVNAFRLVDPEAVPPRGHGWRNWSPLLIDGDDLLIGPSPEMLRRLLGAVGYFGSAGAFGQQLLLQLHRFSLDHYDGYIVREQSFAPGDRTLTITGDATRAGRPGTFETVATRDNVEFSARETKSELGL